MARQESTYPGTIDVFINAATDFNAGDAVPSTDFERLVDAIKKIETELGTDPAGASADLVTRLAAVTAAEFGQIANIGANAITASIWTQIAAMGVTTVSAAQWGYLGGSSGIDHYVDRGDPVAADFDTFTTDLDWHDLDLSSIVPAGAVLVHLYIQIIDDAAGSYFNVREKGNSNSWNVATIRTQVTDIYMDGNVLVSCDSDRVIQYMGADTTFTAINITVRGWWIP